MRGLCWYEYWEGLEADAYLLGVDNKTYWESTPKLVMAICTKKIEQIRLEKEEQLEIAKYQSYLNMIGYHNPKKFPTDSSQKTRVNKPMDDSMQEQAILSLKKLYG